MRGIAPAQRDDPANVDAQAEHCTPQSVPTRRSSDLHTGGTHRGKAWTVEDWKLSKTGHATITVRQDSGVCRSEEHTSELQSRFDLVCRLLLEKKNPSASSCRGRSL